MKEKTIKDFKVISNSNLSNFEKEVKSFLNEHQDAISLQTNSTSTSKGHYCHIFWEEKKLVPEDIRDEYILRGEKYCCGNCPLWGGNVDNGRPECLRQVRMKDTRLCSGACLWFYQQIANGEFRPVENSDLEIMKKEAERFKEVLEE